MNSETLVQFKNESETFSFKKILATKGMHFKSLGLYNEGLEVPTYVWGYVKLA